MVFALLGDPMGLCSSELSSPRLLVYIVTTEQQKKVLWPQPRSKYGAVLLGLHCRLSIGRLTGGTEMIGKKVFNLT